jgi:glutamate 5-kinase
MKRLLELDVLPIINENDTVSTDEIAVGDNDTLGALVAVSAQADLLVVLTDIDGLYTSDPRKDPNAKLVREVRTITPELRAAAGGGGSSLSTGGMVTKLRAAELCMAAGTDMLIVNGAQPEILYRVLDGEELGTRFVGAGK